jgi:hypothetical protein
MQRNYNVNKRVSMFTYHLEYVVFFRVYMLTYYFVYSRFIFLVFPRLHIILFVNKMICKHGKRKKYIKKLHCRQINM